jgi:hypothetical protein
MYVCRVRPNNKNTKHFTWPDFPSVSGNTSVLWLLNFTKMEASFPFT